LSYVKIFAVTIMKRFYPRFSMKLCSALQCNFERLGKLCWSYMHKYA